MAQRRRRAVRRTRDCVGVVSPRLDRGRSPRQNPQLVPLRTAAKAGRVRVPAFLSVAVVPSVLGFRGATGSASWFAYCGVGWCAVPASCCLGSRASSSRSGCCCCWSLTAPPLPHRCPGRPQQPEAANRGATNVRCHGVRLLTSAQRLMTATAAVPEAANDCQS